MTLHCARTWPAGGLVRVLLSCLRGVSRGASGEAPAIALMPPSETAFAFFFKYRPVAFARGELGLEAGWVTFGLLLLVAAALTLTLLRYPQAGGRASRRERIALTTLRIAILGQRLSSCRNRLMSSRLTEASPSLS